MQQPSELTLLNSRNGQPAFRFFSFSDPDQFEQIQRNPFYSLIWIKDGTGKVKSDFEEHAFAGSNLFSFAPYQPFLFEFSQLTDAVAIYFHADFFCIHKHQPEIECNGVLFNNVYQPPFVRVDETVAAILNMLCTQIQTEMQQPALAQYELLVSYLKIGLINAARLKIAQHQAASESIDHGKEPFILKDLRDAIETHFRKKHSPAEYAELLHITPKALAKITKSYFQKTLSSLINERIIIEAKRELYLSNKTVKEIAHELGYDDEYYFSRFFKVNAEVSPQQYRDTVGFARGAA